MKLRNIILTAIVLVVGGCQLGDELLAYAAGAPVRLMASTGSLDSVDAQHDPVPELLHASVSADTLRLVVRTSFYTSGPFSRPYLTVDAAH